MILSGKSSFSKDFGAKSPKPTTLLFSVGNSIEVAVLRSCQTVGEMPRSLEMGWDKAAGEYSTASLKIYPGALCKGISAVCQLWLEAFLPPSPPSVSASLGISDFVHFTERLDRQFNYAVQRGADFHRPNSETVILKFHYQESNCQDPALAHSRSKRTRMSVHVLPFSKL